MRPSVPNPPADLKALRNRDRSSANLEPHRIKLNGHEVAEIAVDEIAGLDELDLAGNRDSQTPALFARRQHLDVRIAPTLRDREDKRASWHRMRPSVLELPFLLIECRQRRWRAPAGRRNFHQPLVPQGRKDDAAIFGPGGPGGLDGRVGDFQGLSPADQEARATSRHVRKIRATCCRERRTDSFRRSCPAAPGPARPRSGASGRKCDVFDPSRSRRSTRATDHRAKPQTSLRRDLPRSARANRTGGGRDCRRRCSQPGETRGRAGDSAVNRDSLDIIGHRP